MDGQAVTAGGSISDIYVGFMVDGYKLGGTVATSSFYFSGMLNAALDTVSGTFSGFAVDGTRWGGLFNLRFVPVIRNFPPIVSVLPDPSGRPYAVGQGVSITVVAPDPDPEDVVALSATAMPPGLSFASSPGNPATGTITGVFSTEGIYPVSLVATDNWGNSGFVTIQFLVYKVEPFIEPKCLSRILEMDGTKSSRNAGSKVGVVVTSPFEHGPHDLRITLSNAKVVEFANYPKGTLQVSSSRSCPVGHAEFFEDLNLVDGDDGVGKVEVTVSWDGIEYKRTVGVVSYRPKVDWQPIPLVTLPLPPGNMADLGVTGPAQITKFCSTSPSAEADVRMVGRFHGPVELSTPFKATVSVKVDLGDAGLGCRDARVRAAIHATQEVSSSGLFDGNFQSPTAVQFYQTATSDLPYWPFVGMSTSPFQIEMVGRGRHSWDDSFGPFPPGHFAFAAWNSYMITHDQTYDLTVTHKFRVVRNGAGDTEGNLKMPGVKLCIYLSRDE